MKEKFEMPLILWLMTLPEPIQSKALKNLDKQDADILYRNLHGAICGAFVWFFTPEGESYWTEIYNKLRDSNDESIN